MALQLISGGSLAAGETLNHIEDRGALRPGVRDRLAALPADLQIRLRPEWSDDAVDSLAASVADDREEFLAGLQRVLAAARDELPMARSKRCVDPELVDQLVRRLDFYRRPATAS